MKIIDFIHSAYSTRTRSSWEGPNALPIYMSTTLMKNGNNAIIDIPASIYHEMTESFIRYRILEEERIVKTKIFLNENHFYDINNLSNLISRCSYCGNLVKCKKDNTIFYGMNSLILDGDLSPLLVPFIRIYSKWFKYADDEDDGYYSFKSEPCIWISNKIMRATEGILKSMKTNIANIVCNEPISFRDIIANREPVTMKPNIIVGTVTPMVDRPAQLNTPFFNEREINEWVRKAIEEFL